MKSAFILTLVVYPSSTLAFHTPPVTTALTRTVANTLRMADELTSSNTDGEVFVPVTPAQPKMSQSLPWMVRPAALDGTMVGDVGFDPLNLAKSKEDLFNYREAEIKHGRLAMLAAAGWPLSELLDKPIANLLGAPAIVDTTQRAPSVLNGGLGKISPIYWVLCLVAASAIDVAQNDKASKNEPGYFAGNLGFDPLGLYPKDAEGQERMQLAELKNGRLGMIAITAFAFQEFATSLGVVNETPFFFKPIGQVMHDATNSGYFLP